MSKRYEEYKRVSNDFISLYNMYQPTPTQSVKVLEARLQNTRDFLSMLGNPDQKMKIVHVAGTSGKGSVTRLIHGMIHEAGHVVGSYVSPHTTTFLERYLFQDGLMPTDHFIDSIKEVMERYEVFLQKKPPLSFFSLATCLALYGSHKAGATHFVLETGVGGRFDDTNAIYDSEVAVITNVSKDHMHILGDTLEQIAQAKSGIMREQRVAIVGESRPRLKKIFIDEAVKKEVALFFVKPEIKHRNPHLAGEHSSLNATLATAAAKEMDIPEEAIQAGLDNYTPLPCRFETISESPLIILDGAHNPAKLTACAELATRLNKKLHIIIAATGKKEIQKGLKLLLPIAEQIHATRFTGTYKKSQNPALILKMIPASKRGRMFLDPREALKTVKAGLKKNEAILVTGSLYLAGELRQEWVSEEHIIEHSSSALH